MGNDITWVKSPFVESKLRATLPVCLVLWERAENHHPAHARRLPACSSPSSCLVPRRQTCLQSPSLHDFSLLRRWSETLFWICLPLLCSLTAIALLLSINFPPAAGEDNDILGKTIWSVTASLFLHCVTERRQVCHITRNDTLTPGNRSQVSPITEFCVV